MVGDPTITPLTTRVVTAMGLCCCWWGWWSLSLSLAWMFLLPPVTSAPCCGPDQWAAEVRVVTMDTNSGSDGIKDWMWVSYDLKMKKIAVIRFNPTSEFYRRELLDYNKGMRYVTPDEVKCKAFPLQGSMPRLCVPPPTGNITLDIRMFFGVFPDPSQHDPHQSLTAFPSDDDISRLPPNSAEKHRRHGPNADDDSMGVFAETIYYEMEDTIGYVTVTSLNCSFMNEMTYARKEDGGFVWRHTQFNNVTQDVDPQSFDMPHSCFNATDHHNNLHQPDVSTDVMSTALGTMKHIFDDIFLVS